MTSITRLPSSEGLLRAADLRKLVGTDAEDRIVDAIVRDADRVLPHYGITTPLRLCHFLAQIAHESGGFTIDAENMHYQPARIMQIFGVGKHSARVTTTEAARLAGDPEALAERVYGLGNSRKSSELGNTQPGDGFRYRGTGLIQITGRANHARYEHVCGGPLGEHLLAVAAAFWMERGCNKFADANDLRGVTKRINGGHNGLADRERCFRRAWGIWGDGRSTVGERALATPRDLKAAGSTIAKGATEVGAVGTASVAVGAVKGVTDAIGTTPAPSPDLIATVKDITSGLDTTRSAVTALADTVQWMLAHWWLGAIIGGVYLWTKHRAFILSRLKNFRLDSA